jgi:hypothetical protein
VYHSGQARAIMRSHNSDFGHPHRRRLNMLPTLREATLRGHDVELSWNDGRPPATLSLVWLRDNSQDAGSMHPDTKQRLVDTFGIAPDIRAQSILLEEQGRVLRVDWAEGGTVSRYDAGFLSGLRFNPDVLPIEPWTWNRDEIAARVPWWGTRPS